MQEQIADKRITDTSELIVESHGTDGAYNSYGHLAYNLKYDKEKELASGSTVRDKNASVKNAKKTAGGIIVIAGRAVSEHECDAQSVHQIIMVIGEIIKRKKLAVSWSIGCYLNQSYSYKENELFDENSYCIELTGILKETLMEFAKKLCVILGQDVLVKPYEDSEIIFIDDFDRRWERKFGKPQTRLMAVEDFDEWWREIMDFE